MKVQHVASPTIPAPLNAKTEASDAARAKAIALLSGSPTPSNQNQNAVSPEERAAVSPQRQPEALESTAEDQPDTSESPASEEAAPPAKESPLSSQYAIIARKEKALRQQVAEFNRQRDAWKAEQQAKPAVNPFDESKYIPKDRLTNDLYGVLSEQGLNYDQVTQAFLNQQTQDPATRHAIRQLQAQIKAQNEQLEKFSKNSEEQQITQRQQAIKQIKNEASQLVYTDPNFETIKATNSVGDVVELIEKTFDKDGILLTVEEAAQAVEEHLVEEAMKITRIAKIQQRMNGGKSTTAGKQAQETKQPPTPQPSKTLTNSLGTSRQLSARERALAAFKGEKQ